MTHTYIYNESRPLTRWAALAVCLLLAAMPACAQQTARERKALRDSLAAASQRLAYHPDSIDLLLRKAAWNVELGEWAYAKDAYDRVLALEPANPAALYFRGYVNGRMGRYAFARLDYQNLLLLVPGHFSARLGLAMLHATNRHYREAMDEANILCTQYPDSALAFAARGGIERDQDMLELALYDYSRAMTLAPADTDYPLAYADLCLRLGRRDDALATLRRLERMGVAHGALIDLYRRAKGAGK